MEWLGNIAFCTAVNVIQPIQLNLSFHKRTRDVGLLFINCRKLRELPLYSKKICRRKFPMWTQRCFADIIPSLEVKISNDPSSLARSQFTVHAFGRKTFIELAIYKRIKRQVFIVSQGSSQMFYWKYLGPSGWGHFRIFTWAQDLRCSNPQIHVISRVYATDLNNTGSRTQY